MSLKELTNEQLLKGYGQTIAEGVKQTNFRKGGATKKNASMERAYVQELFKRLNVPSEGIDDFIEQD